MISIPCSCGMRGSLRSACQGMSRQALQESETDPERRCRGPPDLAFLGRGDRTRTCNPRFWSSPQAWNGWKRVGTWRSASPPHPVRMPLSVPVSVSLHILRYPKMTVGQEVKVLRRLAAMLLLALLVASTPTVAQSADTETLLARIEALEARV